MPSASFFLLYIFLCLPSSHVLPDAIAPPYFVHVHTHSGGNALPTLIIHGRMDPLIPLRDGELLRDGLCNRDQDISACSRHPNPCAFLSRSVTSSHISRCRRYGTRTCPATLRYCFPYYPAKIDHASTDRSIQRTVSYRSNENCRQGDSNDCPKQQTTSFGL